MLTDLLTSRQHFGISRTKHPWHECWTSESRHLLGDGGEVFLNGFDQRSHGTRVGDEEEWQRTHADRSLRTCRYIIT